MNLEKGTLTKLSRTTWFIILMALCLLFVYLASDESNLNSKIFEIKEFLGGVLGRSGLSALLMLVYYEYLVGVILAATLFFLFLKYVLRNERAITYSAYFCASLIVAAYLHIWIYVFPKINWH